MALIKSVCHLHHRSGLAIDDDLVTFYYDNTGLSGINASLTAFWSTRTSPQVNSLISYYAPCMVGNMTIESYTLPTPPTGSTGPPFDVSVVSIGVPGASLGLPSECALALSYHADYTGVPEHAGNFRPRARYRGRIFLGPLNVTCKVDDGTTGETRPSTTFCQDVVYAYQHLSLALNHQLKVFSRKDATLRTVISASADDAFDTQRRRGVKPSTAFSQAV